MKNIVMFIAMTGLSMTAIADGELPITINIQANSRIVIKAQEGESKYIASKIYTCVQPKVGAVAGTAGVQLFELDAGMNSPTLTDANGNSWIVHCAGGTNGAPIPPPPKA
jgi:hypothetical protein